MTDDTTEPATDHDTETPEQPARVRVPNVRPTAVSGLDHEVLNPDAAAEAEDAEPYTIPVPETVETAQQAEGETVESDTAGTGEAVNADTGEVTAPGDPLPEIPATEGTPVPPTEPPAEGTVPDDGTTGDPDDGPGEDPTGSEEAGEQNEGTEAPAV